MPPPPGSALSPLEHRTRSCRAGNAEQKLDGAINDFLAEQARCKLVALWRGRSRACPRVQERALGLCARAPYSMPVIRVAPLGLEDVEVHVVAHVATRGWFVGLEVPWRARPLAQLLIDDMAAALARPHGLVKGGEVPARSEAALESAQTSAWSERSARFSSS